MRSAEPLTGHSALFHQCLCTNMIVYDFCALEMQAAYSRGKDEEPQRQINGRAKNENERIDIRE